MNRQEADAVIEWGRLNTFRGLINLSYAQFKNHINSLVSDDYLSFDMKVKLIDWYREAERNTYNFVKFLDTLMQPFEYICSDCGSRAEIVLGGYVKCPKCESFKWEKQYLPEPPEDK